MRLVGTVQLAALRPRPVSMVRHHTLLVVRGCACRAGDGQI